MHISKGEFQTVIGLIGDTTKLDADLIASLSMVEAVRRVSDPFKSANRKFHPDDSVIDCSGVKVGARNMQNFELLKELGKTDKPILLKRGLSSTIKE